MSDVRRLVLLAMATAAWIAMLAPSAASQHTIEVLKEDEAGNTHCSAIAISEHRAVEGSCTTRFVGALEIYQHNGLAEVLFSDCDYEMEAVFNEIGFGYLYNQVMTPEGAACGREPCDEGAGLGGPGVAPHRNLAWQAQINEPGSGGTGAEAMRVVLCLRMHSSDPTTEGAAGTPCVMDLQIETAGHAYELATPADFQGNGGAPCVNLLDAIEFEGSLVTAPNEQHPNDIEIVHLDG